MDLEVITTLSDALKDWERRHGYNEKQAAEAVGIPRSTWQRYKTTPGLIPERKNLFKLAEVLHMSIGDVTMIAAKKDPQANDEDDV
jgi:uncharacterized protein (DUF2384 family)